MLRAKSLDEYRDQLASVIQIGRCIRNEIELQSLHIVYQTNIEKQNALLARADLNLNRERVVSAARKLRASEQERLSPRDLSDPSQIYTSDTTECLHAYKLIDDAEKIVLSAISQGYEEVDG